MMRGLRSPQCVGHLINDEHETLDMLSFYYKIAKGGSFGKETGTF
jgi:hypothetical protein